MVHWVKLIFRFLHALTQKNKTDTMSNSLRSGHLPVTNKINDEYFGAVPKLPNVNKQGSFTVTKNQKQ